MESRRWKILNVMVPDILRIHYALIFRPECNFDIVGTGHSDPLFKNGDRFDYSDCACYKIYAYYHCISW
jgi:hypothetical protein